MAKKDKEKKKVSAKKEKYLKFHKEKSATIDVRMPELTPEQQKQKQEDEMRINKFLRFSKNAPTKEVSERRMKSKR
ncbi:hypothetical protein C4573_06080 [Candidatus Woesearchaeota archaeon]|nr:MAG: hypothetical protein C4573_06080 [Candidatus Woesearchaeota archaeon]